MASDPQDLFPDQSQCTGGAGGQGTGQREGEEATETVGKWEWFFNYFSNFGESSYTLVSFSVFVSFTQSRDIFKCFFFNLLLERGEGREKERQTWISCL